MRKGHRRTWLTASGAAAATLALSFLLACGCGRDVRLTGKKLREVEVKPVSHFGLTLDENASPIEVAFAAMQAIKADVAAKTPAEREAALDIQFDLAADNEITARESDPANKRERLYTIVHHWTPTVSYYAPNFPGTLEEAQARLVERTAKGGEKELALEVNAPGADPAAQVVMLIWLTKDEGMWRILHFGFDHRMRHAGRPSSDSPPNSRQQVSP